MSYRTPHSSTYLTEKDIQQWIEENTQQFQPTGKLAAEIASDREVIIRDPKVL